MGRRFPIRWAIASVVVVLVIPGAKGADPQNPWQASVKARAEAQELAGQGKPDEGIKVLEQFLTKFPDDPGATTIAVNQLRSHVLALEPAPRRAHWERVVKEFANCPHYYLTAAVEIATDLLYGRNGTERNPQKAFDLCAETITELGTRLPAHSVASTTMYTIQATALRLQGKPDETLSKLEEAATFSPVALAHSGFQDALFELARTTGDTDGMLRAAKLQYVLCEYKEDALQKALDRATQALIAKGGPGLGMKLAKAQEDPKLENPLTEVELPELGNPELLIISAAENPEALLVALLYAGDFGDALAEAKKQMAAKVGRPQDELAAAMRNIARVIKAHDLNLVRANQFLTYHGTGDGEDPLPAFEAELKAEQGK